MENAALQSFTINAAYVPDGGVLVALQSFTLSACEKGQQWQQRLQPRDIFGGGRWRGWW